MLNGAPKLLDYLDDESHEHFNQLCSLLDAMGVKYEINPKLVRGLDYYNKTVLMGHFCIRGTRYRLRRWSL